MIEGQRAGNIQIASYGSASFARARLTGVKTDAFNDINADGLTGYLMFFVKAASPYKGIDQLKGRNLGLVDPNSTSGNNVPRFELDKPGIPMPTLISARSSSPAAMRTRCWRCPRARSMSSNWGPQATTIFTLAQMLHKGMSKNADGSPMKTDDFRIIHNRRRSSTDPMPIIRSFPEAVRRRRLVKAFFDAPTKDNAAFDRLSDGQKKVFIPPPPKDWDGTIELIKFVDNLRKKKAS